MRCLPHLAIPPPTLTLSIELAASAYSKEIQWSPLVAMVPDLIPIKEPTNATDPTSTATVNAQPKPATKPRVKTWTPRVRTGCSTCRARHIKCDERLPVCGKCLLTSKYCDISTPIPFRPKTKEVRNWKDPRPGYLLFQLAVHAADRSKPPMLIQSPSQHASTIEHDWMQGCHNLDRVNFYCHFERRITVQPPSKEETWLHLAPDQLKPVLILTGLMSLLSQENKTAPSHTDANRQLDMASGIEKYQHYYGMVIRSISGGLENPNLYITNSVHGQMINLIIGEITWKSPTLPLHLKGYTTILASRGGIRKVLGRRESSSWSLSYVMVAISTIISTSPATNDLPLKYDSSDDDTYLLYASELHENFPCPTQLYRCIVDINRLRAQDASGHYDNKLIRATTTVILASIQRFKAEGWAERPQLRTSEIRLLIAQVYKFATELYLRLSLNKHTRSQVTLSLRIRMSKRITDLVERLVAICGYHYSQAWPLTVAGAALGCVSFSYQLVIDRHLLAISGMFSSSRGVFIALQCLRKFWASGKTGWEDCFTEWQLCCF